MKKIIILSLAIAFCNNFSIAQKNQNIEPNTFNALFQLIHPTSKALIGVGFFIDTAGTAISFADFFKQKPYPIIKANDGSELEVGNVIAIDNETGIIKFSILKRNTKIFAVTTSTETFIVKQNVQLFDITKTEKNPITAAIQKVQKMENFGTVALCNFSNTDAKNNGNAVFDAYGKAIGIYLFNEFTQPAAIIIDINRITKLQNTKSTSYDTTYLNGLYAFAANKNEIAYQFFTQALKQNSENIAAYLRRGELLNAEQAYQEALQDYMQVLYLEPKNYFAMLGIGLSYMGMQQYNMANDWFTNAIKIDAQNAYGYIKRAEARFYTGSTQAALSDIEQAILLDPKFAEAYYWRGAIKISSNKKKEACTDLQKALQLGFWDAQKLLNDFCK